VLTVVNWVVLRWEKQVVSGLIFAEVCFDVVWYRLNCGCFGVVNVVFLCLGESGYNSITCGAYTSPVYSKVAGENQRIQKHQRNSRFFQCAANNFIFHR
jgi:hypothetical protein